MKISASGGNRAKRACRREKHALIAAVLALSAAFAACTPRPKQPPATLPTPTPVPSPYSAAQLADAVEIADVALSPKGDEIAFVSDASGSLELWTAMIDAQGKVLPAVQRTAAKETVGGLEYAPNGDLVFQMDHGGDERHDLWRLVRGAAKAEPLAATDLAEQGAFFSPDGAKLAYMADTERPFQFDLVVRDMASGKVTPITHEPVNVYGGAWSRDGKLVAGTVTPDDQKGELIVVDIATLKATRIKPPRKDGILWAQAFLPDGRLLATTVNDEGFSQLCIVDVKSGSVTLAGTREWDVEEVAVTDAGDAVYARNVRGESELVGIKALDTRAAVGVIAKGGVITAVAVDPAGTRAAFVRESADRPSEILLVDLATRAAKTAVAPIAGSVDLSRLAKAQLRTFKSFDGKEIDAFVWKPYYAHQGTPPPLVIHVHGGPNGQTRPGFYPSIQALTEAGFVVAAPNYRGSTGYGRAFEDLNNKDWGGGDLKDLLAVVDGLAKTGVIDRSRVGITGGSYGGYMALRAITATPDDWAAAVARYGMPDLVKDYELTVDRFGTWYETEMGTPETHGALFKERSPIHSMDKVKAPLLVLQGANDTNVPQWESDLVVSELKKRGRTVDYVVYPNEGHGFTHRENRLDDMDRTVRFFTTHLAKKTEPRK